MGLFEDKLGLDRWGGGGGRVREGVDWNWGLAPPSLRSYDHQQFAGVKTGALFGPASFLVVYLLVTILFFAGTARSRLLLILYYSSAA